MIRINFSIRPYLKPNGQVMVRVRWNSNKSEVSFVTGVYADAEKWDDDAHKAKRGTVHSVRKMSFSSTEINERISDFRQEIETTFERFSHSNSVPSTAELKNMVNKGLGRNDIQKTEEVVVKKKNMKEMLDWFIEESSREKNWGEGIKQKYIQAYQHITKSNPKIRPDRITVDDMYNLRDWFVKNEYRNRTINKQITVLKVFLRWIDTKEGYKVPANVLNFKTNLKILPKTVTFLHYDELLHFAHFKFEDDKSGRLSRARDYWCFMAFTSLRISDFLRLSEMHLLDGHIEMYAKKTGEHLYIPLTEEAQAIVNRYKGQATNDGHLFDVISAQKLNDAVKDAAKAAGLDRVILETFYIGNERREEANKFYDIISNHDARRTFVSCSLAMGIPAETVMKCTGHKSYNTMKPYIETAIETQTVQMDKWNRNQYRSQIINLLEDANEALLKQILLDVQQKINKKGDAQ